MTPEQFTFWLQGLMEVADPKVLNETQVQIIKDHLNLVFSKKTPDRKDSVIEEQIRKIWDLEPFKDKECGPWKTPEVTCAVQPSPESGIRIKSVTEEGLESLKKSFPPACLTNQGIDASRFPEDAELILAENISNLYA